MIKISTYCILDSTIPLYRYVATGRLKRVTDADRTFWHWESTFATPPGRERELTEQVGRNVYEAGFAALTKYLVKHLVKHFLITGGMLGRVILTRCTRSTA